MVYMAHVKKQKDFEGRGRSKKVVSLGHRSAGGRELRGVETFGGLQTVNEEPF